MQRLGESEGHMRRGVCKMHQKGGCPGECGMRWKGSVWAAGGGGAAARCPHPSPQVQSCRVRFHLTHVGMFTRAFFSHLFSWTA